MMPHCLLGSRRLQLDLARLGLGLLAVLVVLDVDHLGAHGVVLAVLLLVLLSHSRAQHESTAV